MVSDGFWVYRKVFGGNDERSGVWALVVQRIVGGDPCPTPRATGSPVVVRLLLFSDDRLLRNASTAGLDGNCGRNAQSSVGLHRNLCGSTACAARVWRDSGAAFAATVHTAHLSFLRGQHGDILAAAASSHWGHLCRARIFCLGRRVQPFRGFHVLVTDGRSLRY